MLCLVSMVTGAFHSADAFFNLLLVDLSVAVTRALTLLILLASAVWFACKWYLGLYVLQCFLQTLCPLCPPAIQELPELSRNLIWDISPCTVHNIIKRFRKSRESSHTETTAEYLWPLTPLDGTALKTGMLLWWTSLCGLGHTLKNCFQ